MELCIAFTRASIQGEQQAGHNEHQLIHRIELLLHLLVPSCRKEKQKGTCQAKQQLSAWDLHNEKEFHTRSICLFEDSLAKQPNDSLMGLCSSDQKTGPLQSRMLHLDLRERSVNLSQRFQLAVTSLSKEMLADLQAAMPICSNRPLPTIS